MSFCTCGSIEWVTDSRMIVKNGERPYVRRRRQCEKCGKRFTTMEVRCSAKQGIQTHLALDSAMLLSLREQIRNEVVAEIFSTLKTQLNH